MLSSSNFVISNNVSQQFTVLNFLIECPENVRKVICVTLANVDDLNLIV